jgi:hypothetical protein
MTPAECVALAASVGLTAEMRAVEVCAAHPPTAMGGREGAGAAPEMRSPHAADMRSSKPATHMSATEAAADVAATAAAHMAATAAHVAAATATATVATATTAAPTSQSIGRYGSGPERDSRGQDDCSLQLEILHCIFPSVSELNPIVIACRPPQMRDPLRAC